jgi:hypothetical protein
VTGHTDFVCPGNHEGHCMFCDGGLWACSVCGAFEGATTTDCPGTAVDHDTWTLVYEGQRDFRDGRWLDEPSPHTPNGWVTFRGPCPFLTCLDTEAHRHPICPTCEAVRFGNLNCTNCRRHHDINIESRATS